MAARFLTALDYSDWRTSNVLRKHAKKRPLGELECRYQYSPQQPVLSCRTVQVDVSGTARTYRPRSTSDILHAQHSLIHQLLTQNRCKRTVASAPARRQTKKGAGPTVTNENGEPSSPLMSATGKARVRVEGRPCTSLSSVSNKSRSSVSSTSSSSPERLRTAGCPVPEVKRTVTKVPNNHCSQVDGNDDDENDNEATVLESRRCRAKLTKEIHAHWQPHKGSLTQGHPYTRGQKRPDDVQSAASTNVQSWLTSGDPGAGGSSSSAGGVMGAFANNALTGENADGLFNINSTVGSRVAEQLQTGDRIRIGVNGQVRSLDMVVKKCVKDERGLAVKTGAGKRQDSNWQGNREAQETAERAPESYRENPPSLATDSVQDFLPVEVGVRDCPGSLTENDVATTHRSPTALDLPLCWDDQVTRPEVKVISARRTPRESNRENMCETHPVIYNTVIKTLPLRPKLANTSSSSTTNGYRIKQRPVSSGINGRTTSPRVNDTKVRAMTCDPNTAEEEQRLNDISVEDVILTRLELVATSPILGMTRTSRCRSAVSDRSAKKDYAFHQEHREDLIMLENQADRNNKRGASRSASATCKRSVRCLGDSRGGTTATTSNSDAANTTPRSCSGTKVPASVVIDRGLAGKPRPSSSVPFRRFPPNADDLSAVTPVVMSRGGKTDRHGNGRMMRPKTTSSMFNYRGFGTAVNSINAGAIPGDAEFIQISQPIRNPNSSLVTLASGVHSLYSPFPVNSVATSPVPPHQDGGLSTPPRSGTPDSGNGLLLLGNFQSNLYQIPPSQAHNNNNNNTSIHNGCVVGSVRDDGYGYSREDPYSSGFQFSGTLPAISIPTGNLLDEDGEEDGGQEEFTMAQRREMTLRDHHIDHIADMLGGTVLSEGEGGGDGETGDDPLQQEEQKEEEDRNKFGEERVNDKSGKVNCLSEKVNGESEKVNGESEKVNVESESVNGESEKVNGESELVNCDLRNEEVSA